MSVAFCISGHGFGHASRQVEVINAFGALRPDQPIHVFTKASRWLLDRTITVPVTIVEQAVDSGAIQRDSLLLDVPATLASAAQFEAGADDAAVALAREFRARQVQVVVCDAPPMPCTAAHLAGVPAIVLANFTWDWIYEDFIAEHPAFAELPTRLGHPLCAGRCRMAAAHARRLRHVPAPSWTFRGSRAAPGGTAQSCGA